MTRFPRSVAARRQLLASTTPFLIALLATAPAHAQSAPVNAAGDRVMTNTQTSNVLTYATGDGSRAQIDVAGPTDAASVTLGDNVFSATARSNNAALSLEAAPLDAPALRDTSLRASPIGVDASANLVIANSQDLAGGAAQANLLDIPYRVSLGSVSASNVTLGTNSSDSLARGNASIATIVAPDFGGGAGIVSLQTARGNASSSNEIEGVGARVRGGAVLETGALSRSNVSVSGNMGHADSATNATDNRLSASLASPSSSGDSGDPVMLAMPMSSDDAVTARYSILNRQDASNVTKARSGFRIDAVLDSGPAIRLTIDGDVDASAIASDGNTLDANARGNLSANRLALAGSGNGPVSGPLGAIVNIQSLTSARVVSSTHGGAAVDIAGDLTRSSISTNANSFAAEASGNVATDNRLTVSGAAIDGAGSPASALSKASEATFRLDSSQDYGGSSIVATPFGLAARVSVAGNIDGSSVDAASSDVIGRATGNGAANLIAIAASRFGVSAALANRQSGSGSVTTTIGSAGDRAGVTIAASGAVLDASLAVTGNSLTGSATGNVATNGLDLSAATVSGDGSGATVGPVDGDFGAVAALALANVQTLGGLGSAGGTAAITSNVISRTGIDAPDRVTASTLDLDGNRQRADGAGNAASNAASLTAAIDDGAGLALSSTQYGQANVSALSDSILAAPGQFNGTSLRITNNSNVATATINDVANSVAFDAAMLSSVTGSADASVGTLGSATARGDVVLDNQQFATGSAISTATTMIGGIANATVDGSSTTVDGNLATAQSTGNRALNALTANIANGGAGAVLANAQTNMARIDAATSITGSGIGSPASLRGSTVDIADDDAIALARGNVAENDVTIGDRTGTGSVAIAAGNGGIDATAGTVLASAQGNYGAVTARVSSPLALNAGTIDGSSVGIANNAMTAAAYGNAASNTVTVGPMTGGGGIGIANVQANYGPVTAIVSGAGYQGLAGSLTNATIRVTGNQISAVAVGNQASSAIALPR